MHLDELLDRKTSRHRLPRPALRKLLREQSGLTQAEIAALVGVRASAVSRWESGARTPRADVLDRYVAILEQLREVAA